MCRSALTFARGFSRSPLHKAELLRDPPESSRARPGGQALIPCMRGCPQQTKRNPPPRRKLPGGSRPLLISGRRLQRSSRRPRRLWKARIHPVSSRANSAVLAVRRNPRRHPCPEVIFPSPLNPLRLRLRRGLQRMPPGNSPRCFAEWAPPDRKRPLRPRHRGRHRLRQSLLKNPPEARFRVVLRWFSRAASSPWVRARRRSHPGQPMCQLRRYLRRLRATASSRKCSRAWARAKRVNPLPPHPLPHRRRMHLFRSPRRKRPALGNSHKCSAPPGDKPGPGRRRPRHQPNNHQPSQHLKATRADRVSSPRCLKVAVIRRGEHGLRVREAPRNRLHRCLALQRRGPASLPS